MMEIYEAVDNFPARPHRSRRTPLWNVDHEQAEFWDYELQEAFHAAYALVRDLNPDRKALLNILWECKYKPWQEVIRLFGDRNQAGAGVGPTQTLCRLSLIVLKVLHDQFVSPDSGLVVCCLLFTWQKYAGHLQDNIDCIFFLTYDKDLSDVQNAQVPPMAPFQRRMFDHVRSAPAEVQLALPYPPPSFARLSYSAVSAGSPRRP